MVKAVIFDLDGLLIDSEPLWHEAELKTFVPLGVPLTPAMILQTTGLRSDEVVHYWYTRYPWTSPTPEDVDKLLLDEVIELIQARAKPLPGVQEVVAFFAERDIPMAIASSSPTRIIEAAVVKLPLGDNIKLFYSAESEPYGKPHPGVYLTTATQLGVHPTDCLAFEDSVNGVIAAKAAKMKCVAVPEPTARDDKRYGMADLKLASLVDFNEHMLGSL
jgi:HAD superfamily hydrolase (TIGR01509 family)